MRMALSNSYEQLGSMQVSNPNSDIQIFLPKKASFELDARSRGGESNRTLMPQDR